MGRKSTKPLPALQRLLSKLGANIRLARLRRGFSQSIIAERTGMSRPTISAIEKGNPGVTIGSYANVLHSLGLHDELASIASDDELGRKLQDAKLEVRKRARKKNY